MGLAYFPVFERNDLPGVEHVVCVHANPDAYPAADVESDLNNMLALLRAASAASVRFRIVVDF